MAHFVALFAECCLAGAEGLAGRAAPGPAGDRSGEVGHFGVSKGSSGEVVGNDSFVALPGVGEHIRFPSSLWAVPVASDGAVSPMSCEVKQRDIAAYSRLAEGLAEVVGAGQRPAVRAFR